MKAAKCRLCGHEHWNSEPHKWDATNSVTPASNTASNVTESASNRASNRKESATVAREGKSRSTERRAEVAVEGPAVASGNARGDGRKQRWDRKAYNAYQREYMRALRAKG